jgi:hypothetical protein
MGADSSVGWGDGRNPNKLRCHCVGVRKLTPTYQCSIKTTLMDHQLTQLFFCHWLGEQVVLIRGSNIHLDKITR